MRSKSFPYTLHPTPYTLSLALTRPSLRSLLQQHIVNSLQLSIIPDNIPLSRQPKSSQIVYCCALAFQLASQQNSSPQRIATQLMEALASVNFPSSDSPIIEFTVEQLEQGWINFYLSDRALAVWLQQLPSLLPPALLSQDEPYLPSPNFNSFLCQYAHARCCSLLRLAHREGLIELSNPTFNWSTILIQNPIHPYPPFPRGASKIQNPERQAINQFLTVTEKLDDSQLSNWGQLATKLSQVILTVERDCRIFGAIAQENPQLAQARIGLISLAQMLLKAILQEKMGLWTPKEL